MPAWQALRIKAQQRGERPQPRHGGALVGRDEELAVLKQTLRRVQAEGRPALVTVDRAGRRRQVPPRRASWSTTSRACRSSSTGGAAGASRTATRRTRRSPTRSRRSARSSRTTRPTWPRRRPTTPCASSSATTAIAPQIRALVGAGEARSFSREDLFEAWRRFLERLAARYPLVLVLEDIHWADDGLLDFIEHAADWAQGPIMRRSRSPGPSCSRRAAALGRRQAERRLDLPRSALGGRGRARCSAICSSGDVDAGRSRDDRRTQRGQPALRRGDRPQADRRRRAAGDRGVAVGGGASGRRRRAARVRSRG